MTSSWLGQLSDCLSVIEENLRDIGQAEQYETKTRCKKLEHSGFYIIRYHSLPSLRYLHATDCLIDAAWLYLLYKVMFTLSKQYAKDGFHMIFLTIQEIDVYVLPSPVA